MVYHLTLEARRPPQWLSGAQQTQDAARLRAGLGVLARDVSLRWQAESSLVVVLRYEADDRRSCDVHQSALAALIHAAERAGLHPTGAVVTRVLSHWTQGAIAGALTGFGLSQTTEDYLAPAIAVAAIVMGAVAGALLRREVPVFRALRLPYAGWRLVAVDPEVSTPRFRVGLA